jgi:hypothetical protein
MPRAMNADLALECERCHEPMVLVRTAIVGLWRKRLYFLCMHCGAVRTFEPA